MPIKNLIAMKQFYRCLIWVIPFVMFIKTGDAQGLFPPYHANFDTTNNGWYSDATIWQHGTPNASIINSAWSGTGVWATELNGNYPNSANTYLYTPAFNFSTAQFPDTFKISFYHWMAVADQNDYGMVQYSLDGGITWLFLGFYGDPFGVNWHNAQSGGVHFFNHQNSGWMFSSYKLNPPTFIGQSDVRFRFRFNSNGANTSNGWAIDDFKVEVPQVSHVVPIGFKVPLNDTLAGTVLNVEVVLTNHGYIPKIQIPLMLSVNGMPKASVTSPDTLMPQDTISYTFQTPIAVPSGVWQLKAEVTAFSGPFFSASYYKSFNGLPSATGSLYGNIYHAAGAAGSSEIFLIQHDTVTGSLTAIQNTNSTGTGSTQYQFGNISPGNYLVKAALLPTNPLYLNYLPTYYPSTLFWNQATTVQVAAGSGIQAPIQMIGGTNPGGPGFIGGLISQGANKGPGDPEPGVLVMLLDAGNNDNPVAFQYSDSLGAFGFSNIPYSTYKVYAEIPGKTTFPNIVTIDVNHPNSNSIQIVVGTHVISGIEQVNAAIPGKVGMPYPNPSAEECYLPVTLTSGMNLTMELSDLTGRTLMHEIRELPAGYSLLRIPVNEILNGVYFVTIRGENGWITTRKLVKQN
jgi:hypothetical protein